MAKYSRKEMEKQGNAEVGAGVGLMAGLTALLVGTMACSSNKNKKKEEIQNINQQILEYKSEFLGSIRHADKISELEARKAELQGELE